MRTHPRIRWMSKWAFALVCIFIVGVWGLSLFYWAGTMVGDRWLVTVNRGRLHLFHNDRMYITGSLFDLDVSIDARAWGGFGFCWPTITKSTTWSGLPTARYMIPFWLVLIAVAIPTAWFSYRDYQLRPRRGFCDQCGYDLTGNTSGVCTECGMRCTDQ